MRLLNVDCVDQAVERLRSVAGQAWAKTERLSLAEARGRVLAKDIYAAEDVPGFSRSTVDGYAVIAADTAAASENLPAILRLRGSVDMGQAALTAIAPGECAYVPTGAMLPPVADAVVMLEYCEPLGDQVAVGAAISPGRNVVYRGEDLSSGNLALPRGRRLGPAEIGVLAALGLTEIPVYSRPALALFSSGDEVVLPSDTPKPGQVRDINGPALAALAEQAGFQVTAAAILPDDPERLRAVLRQALTGHDLVVISGGSSQGQKDLTSRIFDEIASPGVFTHGLAVKPGKPTILGFNEATQTVLAGLPGHPLSALMVFSAVLLPWWQSLTGQQPSLPLPAQLTRNVAADAGKTTFQPVRLAWREGGLLACPLYYKSGLISILAQADGYIVMERNCEGLNAGVMVPVHAFWR